MVRNIDVAMSGSLLSHSKLSMSNSHTDGNALFLFGNKIAWFDEYNALTFSMCGYGSSTTRSRLNAVLNDYLEHLHNYNQSNVSIKDVTNIGITQRDYDQKFLVCRKNKKDLLIPIDSSKSYVIIDLLKNLDLTEAQLKIKNKKETEKPKQKFKAVWVLPKGDNKK